MVKVIDKVLPWLPLKRFSTGLTHRNPQAEEDFLNDPLNYTGKINSKTAVQLMNLIEYFQSEVRDEVDVPTVLLQGGTDKVISEEDSELFI